MMTTLRHPATQMLLMQLARVCQEQDKASSPSLSLIPALFELGKTSWDKSPAMAQVPRKIEDQYKTHGSDSDFVTKHPSPNSIVIKATQYKSCTRSLVTPTDKEGEKKGHFGQKVLHLCCPSN